MATDADLLYEMHTHLLYELKWLIFAAHRFQLSRPDDPHVALIDSATVHARNLFEFASTRKRGFTLAAIGGEPVTAKDWGRWANNRVTHMLLREHDRAPWPDGLDNQRPDRLMVMANRVLEVMEAGARTIRTKSLRDSFSEVVAAARAYWLNPDEANHDSLQALYDSSRDHRTY